jgi:hypothetical protein
MRLCAMSCGATDEACVNTCKSRGNATEQANFQALMDCTKDAARGGCPAPYLIDDCTCLAQCFDGACLAETDTCVAGATDLVCDLSCH